MSDHDLGAATWCGIVMVAAGAADPLVDVCAGVALLKLEAAWFGGACYRDYRSAAG
jgi:hypothetical protein